MSKQIPYSPNILFRLGHTNSLIEDYINSSLTFSCALNWFSYAMKKYNLTTGDYLEGVMGNVKYTENLKNSITDSNGVPLNNNLLITPYGDRKYCYLRYIPTMLMPAICFYGIDVQNLLSNKTQAFFDFSKYCAIMEYSLEDSSILIIRNMKMFEEDLKNAIIESINLNTQKLTNDGFVKSFSPNNPYIGKFIDYNAYNYRVPFLDHTNNAKALFIKDKRYEKQSEYRIVINNIRFSKRIDCENDCENYDYKVNTLNIKLPNFHNYAELLSIKEYSGINFVQFDSENYITYKMKR